MEKMNPIFLSRRTSPDGFLAVMPKKRGCPTCNTSQLRGVLKTVLQVLSTAAFFCLLPPSADSLARDANESGSEYKLGPQDEVRIRIHEWRPLEDKIFEWKALNNEDNYTVSPSGHLALPLLGDIPVSGMSTAEVARQIGQRLKERMGLFESPDTIVEIVKFRPFYIMGAVQNPGAYPYQPGLTVLKAYSIAGGRQRNAPTLMRLEKEAITTRGVLKKIDLEKYGLVARMARLNAELANNENIDLPLALLKKRMLDKSLDRIVKKEQLMFTTRKKALETQLHALNQLHSYLEQAAISMQNRLKYQNKQIETVQEELDSILKLFKKGLASAPRKLALERALAQANGDLLHLESTLMGARQEVGKTKIAVTDLHAKRTSEISKEMRQTQARLEEIERESDTSQQLLFEAEVLAPQVLSAQTRQQLQPIFKIVRQSRGSVSELAATETTIVEPGDTVKVEMPIKDISIPSVAPSSNKLDSARVHSSTDNIPDDLR